MGLIDRLGERLGELIDDVSLPGDLVRRLDDAEQRLAGGDADGALALVRAVDAVRPNTWRARVLAGLALEARGDLRAAADELGRAVELRDDTLVRVQLGRIWTELGALRTAREHFDRALARRPADPERLELLLAVAALDERIGPPQRAIAALRLAHRLAPTDPQLATRLARALEADGDLDAGLAVLAPLLEQEPASLEALLLAARLRRERGAAGDRTACRGLLERVLERSSDNAEALEGLGLLLRTEGDVAGAMPLLRHALTMAPLSSQARLQRAVAGCLETGGAWEAAADAWRASLVFEDAADGWVGLSRSALATGATAEALDAAREGVARSDRGRAAIAALGRAELACGDIEAATRTLAGLRAARMSADELDVLGELALQTGDTVEALALLREASVLAPWRRDVAARLASAVARLAPALPSLPSAAELDAGTLVPFLDALGRATASHPLLTALLPRVTALRQRLDAPLAVAVLGEFNAGKSTWINAFVGEAMLATGVLPTTSHVNVVRYGPRRVARWTRHDGSVVEVPYAEAARLTRREPESIAALELCYPHPDLRAVHLWDTPGFNAPDAAHEERAATALRTADAVVWVVDVNQALSGTQFARLREIPNPAERLLVVLNKSDRIDPEARVEVEAHVRNYLREDVIGVYWLSALRALEARRPREDGEEAPADDGGWATLREALDARVFERAGRLKALELTTELAALIRLAVEAGGRAAATVGEGAAALTALRDELGRREARWLGDVTGTWRSVVNRRLQDGRARVADELAQMVSPGSGLFARLELHADDRALAKGRLRERAASAYREGAEVVLAGAEGVDAAVTEVIEEIAIRLGPPESRTLRRRLEGYLSEAEALRGAVRDRLVELPLAAVDARLAELGDAVMDRVATEAGWGEAERDSQMQRLAPPAPASLAERVGTFGAEYIAAALRSCDHLARDLDILALDLDHRIIGPFVAAGAVFGVDEREPGAGPARVDGEQY